MGCGGRVLQESMRLGALGAIGIALGVLLMFTDEGSLRTAEARLSVGYHVATSVLLLLCLNSVLLSISLAAIPSSATVTRRHFVGQKFHNVFRNHDRYPVVCRPAISIPPRLHRKTASRQCSPHCLARCNGRANERAQNELEQRSIRRDYGDGTSHVRPRGSFRSSAIHQFPGAQQTRSQSPLSSISDRLGRGHDAGRERREER